MLKQDFLSHFLAKFLAFCLRKKIFFGKVDYFYPALWIFKKVKFNKIQQFSLRFNFAYQEM